MFTPADEEPSLFITVQNVLWHAYLVIVEAHLTGLQMLTSGDEHILLVRPSFYSWPHISSHHSLTIDQ